jgi:hypothetical protein
LFTKLVPKLRPFPTSKKPIKTFETMKFVTHKTEYLERYLNENSQFIQYEIDGDFIIINVRNEEKIFWLGFGYNKYLNENNL